MKIVGDLVRLRPIGDDDLPTIHGLEQTGWHCGRPLPPPSALEADDEYAERLRVGALSQFLVDEHARRTTVGMVSLYDVNRVDRWGYLAAAKFNSLDTSMSLIHGAVLFIDFVFNRWDLRKLYMEVAGHVYDNDLSMVPRLLDYEGVLSEHRYYQGRYEDCHVLSIRRESWHDHGAPVLRRVRDGVVSDASGSPVGTPSHGEGSLSQHDFLLRVTQLFKGEVPAHRITADAWLDRDMNLDSLQCVRLALEMERLAGTRLPDDFDPGDLTLTDCYSVYRTLSDPPSSADRDEP